MTPAHIIASNAKDHDPGFRSKIKEMTVAELTALLALMRRNHLGQEEDVRIIRDTLMQKHFGRQLKDPAAS